MDEPIIRNSRSERLYTIVEGNVSSDKTIIFVHGFFATLHENGYFDDLVVGLSDEYRIVRFDLSGVGQSEGASESGNYKKWAGDLDAVLSYVQSVYSGSLYVFAQSMGCFVTTRLCPPGITKAIMTGIPNSNVSYVQTCMVDYFGNRPGAHIDVRGFSRIPRKSGAITQVGPSFWSELAQCEPIEMLTHFTALTPTHVMHAGNDEVLGDRYVNDYDTLPYVTAETIPGTTHSFIGTDVRKYIVRYTKQFFT
jgi:pimeloyl-ACP methyl ester carboxylesterase